MVNDWYGETEEAAADEHLINFLLFQGNMWMKTLFLFRDWNWFENLWGFKAKTCSVSWYNNNFVVLEKSFHYNYLYLSQ